MGETRVQTATLVCKIFLRYLDQLPNAEGMLELWLKILDILDRMMNSGQGDSLVSSLFSLDLTGITRYLTPAQEEAIPESIKNIILVMADQGHLVPPSQDASKESIWIETKKRLERFLPDLFKEIFPDAPKETPPVSKPASPLPTTPAEQPSENTPGDKEKENEHEAQPENENENGKDNQAVFEAPKAEDEKTESEQS